MFINLAHSTISSCLPKIDGHPVGHRRVIVHLLIECITCVLPNVHIDTWDGTGQKCLESLRLMELLSLKLTSLKLAMLFSLSCPERESSLSKPFLCYCRVSRRSFVHSDNAKKTWFPRSSCQTFFHILPS